MSSNRKTVQNYYENQRGVGQSAQWLRVVPIFVANALNSTGIEPEFFLQFGVDLHDGQSRSA